MSKQSHTPAPSTPATDTATPAAVRLSPRTGKPVRPYHRRKPGEPPRRYSGPKERNRQQAAKLTQEARNVQQFGVAIPPDEMIEVSPDLYDPKNPGDFLLIPQRLRARAVTFLEKLSQCKRWHQAQVAANVRYWEVEYAGKMSADYRRTLDAIKEQIIKDRVVDIEHALAADAAGEEPEPGRRRPDNRNAALFLAANDPRYRPQAAGSGATVILDVHI